jgi:solute carrier family 25 phosphate transporter 23/24/25/41
MEVRDQDTSSTEAETYHNFFRNFLLFLPVGKNLESVLDYYNSTTVSISAEGDVHVSSATSSGTGTFLMFLELFFGTIFLVANAHHNPPSLVHSKRSLFKIGTTSSADEASLLKGRTDGTEASLAMTQPAEMLAGEVADSQSPDWSNWEDFKPVLIAFVPSTGYFAAGAIAGIASRTATAPIDRLKVYLIAQTKKPEIAGIDTKSHFKLLQQAYRTTALACSELWKAGGLRSLYAGQYI